MIGIKPRVRRVGKDDTGAVAIVVALFAVVAMLLLAFVIDQGRTFVVRNQLQNAVDAAALAGALQFCGVTGRTATEEAVDYGGRNGITLDPTDIRQVFTQTTGPVSYISVATSQPVDLFFGAFAGTARVAVAARATASRQCSREFQFVADEFVEFTGSGSGEGAWYAGKCFDGKGGTFDIVAVGTTPTFDCNAVRSTFQGVPPGPIQNVGPGTEKAYISGITTLTAITNAGWADTIAALDFTGTPNCQTATVPLSGSVTCSGTQSNDVLKVSGTTSANVFSQGPVDLEQNTVYSGQIIYSAYTSTSENDPAITLNNGVPAGTIIYAPNGAVKFTGGTNDNAGMIFAKYIVLAGGRQTASEGVDLPYAGPTALVQ